MPMSAAAISLLQAADHVYYLNLNASEERRSHMEAQLKAAGLTESGYTRVPAVDGGRLAVRRAVSPATVIYTAIPDGRSPVDLQVLAWDLSVASASNAGAKTIAVTLSHLRAIHAAYVAGHDTALILEDDVDFSAAELLGAADVPQALALLPPDWALLQLSYIVTSVAQAEAMSEAFHGPRRELARRRDPCGTDWTLWGAHAYVISRRGMQALLRRLWPGGVPRAQARRNSAGGAGEDRRIEASSSSDGHLSSGNGSSDDGLDSSGGGGGSRASSRSRGGGSNGSSGGSRRRSSSISGDILGNSGDSRRRIAEEDIELPRLFDLRGVSNHVADYALFYMPGVFVATRPAMLPPRGFNSTLQPGDSNRYMLEGSRRLILQAFSPAAALAAAEELSQQQHERHGQQQQQQQQRHLGTIGGATLAADEPNWRYVPPPPLPTFTASDIPAGFLRGSCEILKQHSRRSGADCAFLLTKLWSFWAVCAAPRRTAESMAGGGGGGGGGAVRSIDARSGFRAPARAEQTMAVLSAVAQFQSIAVPATVEAARAAAGEYCRDTASMIKPEYCAELIDWIELLAEK